MYQFRQQANRHLLWILLGLSLLVPATQASTPSASAAPTSSHQLFLPAMQRDAAATGSGNDTPNDSPNSSAGGSPVQISWFYKPPTDIDLPTLSQNFDHFILTKNDEVERDVLRQLGVSGPFIQYLRFEAIHNPGSCTAQPWRNQVADQPGDFCWIQDNHPDWFLRDGSGNPLIDNEGGEQFYIMDPGNQGWRNFWLQRAREMQETLRWDGVFLDNVEASLAKRARKSGLPARYPTDESYQTAVEGMLAYLYTSYFQPQGRPLTANIIEMRYDATEVWFDYIQYLDGAMEEGWAVDWSNGYLSDGMWEEHLNRVERMEGMGKQSILVSQGRQDNWQRQAFAFISYLLVANGNSTFRYTDSSAYRNSWLYDNYNSDLGAPRGARYFDGYFWVRDFENGRVRVNLNDHTAAIELNHTPSLVAVNQ